MAAGGDGQGRAQGAWRGRGGGEKGTGEESGLSFIGRGTSRERREEEEANGSVVK